MINLESVFKSRNITWPTKVRLVGLWRKLSTKELMLLNCGVGEDSWESLGLQRDPTCPFWKRSALGFLWKEWCWSWNSSTLATWCEELTHWKRLWCWEGLGAGGEGDNRGRDGWMASLTWWTWVWVNSGSWWWTGRPGVLRFMGSQRVGHDWATELNWTTGRYVLTFKKSICKWFVDWRCSFFYLLLCNKLPKYPVEPICHGSVRCLLSWLVLAWESLMWLQLRWQVSKGRTKKDV